MKNKKSHNQLNNEEVKSRASLHEVGIFIALIIAVLFMCTIAYGDMSTLMLEDSADLWRYNGVSTYGSQGNMYVNNNTFYERFSFADSRVNGRVDVSKSGTRGTHSILVGTDFKLDDKPLTNSSMGFKLNLTNDNPVLEKAMLLSVNARWMPYWKLGGTRLGLNMTGRGGILNVTTETEPVDPAYPSQKLAGGEAGVSLSQKLGVLSFAGGASQYITYAQYESVNEKDTQGAHADFGTQLNLAPFLLGAKWKTKQVEYNTNKYFFLDTMEENEYSGHVSYIRNKFDIGVFHGFYKREGTEFNQERFFSGVGIGLYGWMFKGLLTQDTEGDFESSTLSIGKSFKGVRLEAYWTRDEDDITELNNNTMGFAFSYGFQKERVPASHMESFKNYMPYDENPLTQPNSYPTLEDTVENIDSLSKMIRYTRANIDYVYQTEQDKSPQEVFDLKGGDCDEQVFFQHYVLSENDFGNIYEIGFQSPSMCHAFSYGEDKKTGDEYIWEYGRVFKLKYDNDDMSLKEKVAAVLSSRSYSKDWQWFVTYGPDLNYEDFYDDEVIAAEGFRQAPEFFSAGDEIVEIIPESGIQLFIGEEFER